VENGLSIDFPADSHNESGRCEDNERGGAHERMLRRLSGVGDVSYVFVLRRGYAALRCCASSDNVDGTGRCVSTPRRWIATLMYLTRRRGVYTHRVLPLSTLKTDWTWKVKMSRPHRLQRRCTVLELR